MKLNTNTILFILNGISVFIFCVLVAQTVGLIVNSLYLLLKPDGAETMYLGVDIAQLFSLSKIHFSILLVLTVAVSILKAYAFFLTTMIFNTLNIVKPFSQGIAVLISQISYMSLAIGILGAIAYSFSKWQESKGLELKEIQAWFNDYSAFLMMAAVVFVIAQIFKKGLELQSENDLTV